MSQDENGDRDTTTSSSETTESHVTSANLFDKGNTPFRRGLDTKSTTDTKGSPTKSNAANQNNSDKLEKKTTLEGIDSETNGEALTVSQKESSSVDGPDQTAGSTLNVDEISKEIPSFSASLATFEKEWNSIIDKYSNVEDQGDVVDLASGTVVKNNGHLELLEDEEDTIWDSMFPVHKEGAGDGDENGVAVSAPPTPSLLQQLGEFQSESEEEEDGEVKDRKGDEERDEKSVKKRRVSLWDV